MEVKATIHCSVTKNGEAVDVEEIRKWHKKRGWSDIGYHYVIQPDGERQKGRPLNRTGAHVVGHNRNNFGICLIGTDMFTIAQFRAVRYTLEGLEMTYGLKPWNIYCHYEFDSARKTDPPKTCPNIRAVDFTMWYRAQEYGAIEKYVLKKKEWL